jgi:ribosomal protein S17E
MNKILYDKFRGEANEKSKKLNLFTTDYKKNVKLLKVAAEILSKRLKIC